MTRSTVAVRKATMRDIPDISGLINSYAAGGIMLPRTEFEMSENIRDFFVGYEGATLVGCGALHFYTPSGRRSARSRFCRISSNAAFGGCW